MFQHLITAVLSDKTHFICYCQLRSSRTSENCYEHFFLLLILYKDTRLRLAKVAKQFKVNQSRRSISIAWFCWLFCFVGWLFCLFSQSNHLRCAPIKLLSGTILSEPFFMFYVFCLVRTLSLEFLGMLNKIIAWKLAFVHVSGNNTKP